MRDYFYLISLTFFLSSFFNLGFSTPMRCTRISTTNIFDEYDYGNITGSAVLSVYLRDGIQYLSIRDVDVYNFVYNFTANKFCLAGGCTTDLSIPFEVPIGNTTFAIDAYFPDATGIEFFHGIVDDSGFFGLDGTMYTLDKLCSNDIANQSNLVDKEIHCCMEFKPVSQAPPNSPRCTTFQSRSSILNIDDNYSIFATSSMTFNLDGNNTLWALGNFTGPSGYNYSVDYFLNQYWMCDNDVGGSDVSCGSIPFPNGDSKFIIAVEFVKWEGNGGYGYGGMMARILIRDGQTLMEEGIPFTTKNNCKYQNFPFGGNPNNQVVNNQFCCTEFEGNNNNKNNNFHPKNQQQKGKMAQKSLIPHLPTIPAGVVKHSQFGFNKQRRIPRSQK